MLKDEKSATIRLQNYSISYPSNFNHGRALRKAAHIDTK